MSQRQQGDTIIEVVIAFAIFTAAAVAAITLINSGLATTQRNLETTLVRQQIDSQAELLRHLRDTRDPVWSQLTASTAIVASPVSLAGAVVSNKCIDPSAVGQAFYIQPQVSPDPSTPTVYSRRAVNSTTYQPAETYAKIDYATGATVSQGIWIQAGKAQEELSAGVPAYDFYIHACWESVGQNAPMVLGTIVRIYE